MTTLNLQIPQIGLPNTTEDPKIASDLTMIQTVINGNIDDTNLKSPTAAKRQLLLQAGAVINGGQSPGEFIMSGSGNIMVVTNVGLAPPAWGGDISNEFQVPNKTAKARIRVCALTNVVAPAITFTVRLTQVTSLAGSGPNIQITGLSDVTGSDAQLVTPVGGGGFVFEGGEFNLPVGSINLLAVVTSGTSATNSSTALSAQLYGYNV